ncbi:MAG: tetratricopeptide repeat protein [Cyclobacteriaceae bacterium]|nr:tetratricopeptide repeat protein [Cyclobacteriaceae bacterium]
MRTLLIILFATVSVFGQSVTTGKQLWEQKKYAEARKQLLAIKKDSKDYAAAQYYLGRVAFDEKKYDEAEDFFETAIDTNNKVADYHTWYGNTLGTIAADANLFKQASLGPKMKSAWEKAVQLDPETVDARESLIQYYLQAPAIAGGSVDKAIEMANEIKKIKPAEGHRQLGNIYYREKKYAEAEKEFIAMTKVDAALTPGLANFYVLQKQYDKAFAISDEALKQNPDDMAATYQIGKLSAISGLQLDRGEACLKKYLSYQPQKNEPSHAGANMRLAQIMEKRGKKTEAKSLYQLALKGDATLKEAKEGLARVSK